MFLQVCDPLLLNRQRSLKHLLTEPEQQNREGSVILNALIEVQQFLDYVRLGSMEVFSVHHFKIQDLYCQVQSTTDKNRIQYIKYNTAH